MNDGVSIWEQTILRQNEELEKLRGFVADYEGTLVEMRSAIREAALLRQQLQDATTLRGAGAGWRGFMGGASNGSVRAVRATVGLWLATTEARCIRIYRQAVHGVIDE